MVAKTAHFALHRSALRQQAFSEIPNGGQRIASLFGVDDVWIGAMAPKRWAKRAVTRNIIKRQIYSVGVDFSKQLDIAAFVVRLRRSFDRKIFPSAESEPLRRAIRAEVQELMIEAMRVPWKK